MDILFFLLLYEKKSKKQERISVTAYDQLIYLKAKQSYDIENKNVGGVVKMIAGDFGLKTGMIENPGYIMPSKLYEEKGLFDIITDCISLTAKATGKVFVLYDDYGKLALREISNLQSRYVLGNDSFATDYTYDTSIEDSYNFIKLVRPNKTTGKADSYVVKDSKKMEEWGHLQFYEKVDEDLNPAQIKERAERYLKYYCQTQRKLKLPCVGLPTIRAGVMVGIDIADLGDISLSKKLLIDKCTHKISSNSHTMDLEMRVYND